MASKDWRSRNMEPDHSESSRRARAFALRATLFFLPLVCWVGLGLVTFANTDFYPYQVLQAHQEAKLVENDEVEVVLLGDSSLGNAIDAQLFSDTTGRETVSLALNGLYGYAGSYNMLRRALAVFPNLEHAVVINTPDMMSRPPSQRGWLLTLESPQALLDVGWQGTSAALAELLRMAAEKETMAYLPKRIAGQTLDPSTVLENDYIRQGERKRPPQVEDWTQRTVHPGKANHLRALVTLAAQNGVHVTYAHGPLWAEQLAASTDYLDAAEREIQDTGVTLVSWRPSIETQDLGNTTDHVAPAHKEAMTLQYASHLRVVLHRSNE